MKNFIVFITFVTYCNIADFSFDIINGCPRKIRDKERSDVNEFFEWRLEKVSNCWLRSVGSNYDTRLDEKSL